MRGVVLECESSEKYFLLGGYVERSAQVLCEAIGPGDVVYDVGANIGYTSLLFSCRCGPKGRVFSFEPSPVNFKRLKRNAELNPSQNMELVNLAASDDEGTASLAERGSESQIVRDTSTQGAQLSPVRTVRLDNFAFRDGNPPPHFVKIDVEGHAGRVLAGMPRLLGEVHPGIFIEIHHAEEDAEVVQALRGLSYQISRVDIRATRDSFPTGILGSRRSPRG